MKATVRALMLAMALTPLAWAGSASAVEYSQLQADKSKITFQYQQMGVKLDGGFKSFSSDIRFDPENLKDSRAALTVDLSSVNAGSPEADAEVVNPTWFNVPKFPEAKFVASSIEAKGKGAYEIAGSLSIKGSSKDVRFPARFEGDGKTGRFTGTMTINRGDFAIGEGEWASDAIVSKDVVISFDLSVAAQ